MPADWLKRQIEALDRSRARPSRIEPERLILAPRHESTRRICFDCRRTPDEIQLRNAWYDAHKDPRGYLLTPWPGVGPDCPYCGGVLVETTG